MGSSGKSDENKQRGNWTGRLDFILSCIGFAVGLGNIWRFPYLCYKSGGGAFMIPYLTFLILCGVPLFFLEISYGQFSSLSPVSVWRFCPLFKGVGYGMVIVSGIVCIYYNIIITWTLYYLFMSFRRVLPWSTCDNVWNTVNCALRGIHAGNSTDNDTLSANETSFPFQDFGNTVQEMVQNSSALSSAINKSTKVTASEEYWRNHVLELSDGIDDIGQIRWQLLLCLALAWILVFLCLCKGIKSSGRVVYFTATFPYLVLLILLVRGVTLPGSMDGIRFYMVPQWERLLEFKVWGDAAVQIFYSVGMAWGGLVTMASYNKFNNNVYRDAMMLPLMNCGTSVFAGFVIFSILGFMAHETGVSIDKVVTQGPGLVFVVYPEAVTNLPISPLWAILFFLMLFTIGLDSQFGMFETMTSAFVDEFPQYLKGKKTLFTALLCFIEFLLGIPCITQGGVYVLQIMDWYASSFSLMLISLMECVVISWVYGINRFYKDIELMIGYQPSVWWKICWCFITPAVILFIWAFSVSQLAPVSYGDYQYPAWAIRFGWFLGVLSLLPVPIVMLIEMLKAKGSFIQRLKICMSPRADWGPAVEQFREQYIASLSKRERERCGIDQAGVRLRSSVNACPKALEAGCPESGAVVCPDENLILKQSDSAC
ncbi:sodium- and chloride-dependent glycine transporter 1-like isoform X2 [Liolophura sinensis]